MNAKAVNDIEPVSARTRCRRIETRRFFTGMLVVLAACLRLSLADAEPREIAARVILANAGRVYLAASDSGVVEPGLLLTFLDRRRTVATGEITSVLDGTLASARLTGGSLARVKKLDRLRVMAELPALLAMPALRVGVPSDARANLAVGCAGASVEFPFGDEGYRVEPLGRGAYRGIRVTPDGPAALWPDTLIVRTFGDAADQEIAFERGELDVAVFWPGERSARLRAAAEGRAGPLGLRSRGLIAAIDAAAVSGNDSSAARRDIGLASLNAELFGGDLLAWAELDPAAIAAVGGPPPPARPYTVDLSLPGHQPIEHFLNGGASLFVRGKLAPLRVAYLDTPLAARDSLAAEWRAQGIIPLFALRCPVVCAPRAAEYVRRLGAERFAQLMSCAPAKRP